MVPFFSILVSTFNPDVELFNEAVDSILGQSFDSYEILVCEQDTKKLEGIKMPNLYYFHVKESSLFRSRLFLMNKARGRYLLFLDDDDKFKKNFFIKLKNYILKTNFCDLYQYSFSYNKSDYFKFNSNFIEDTVSFRQALLDKTIPSSVWTKCIKNVTIKIPPFDIFYGEDIIISMYILNHVKTFSFFKEIGYEYNVGFGGSTKTTLKNILDLEKTFIILITQFPEYDMTKFLSHTIFKICNIIKGIYQSNRKKDFDTFKNITTNKKFIRLSKRTIKKCDINFKLRYFALKYRLYLIIKYFF